MWSIGEFSEVFGKLLVFRVVFLVVFLGFSSVLLGVHRIFLSYFLFWYCLLKIV